MCGVQDLLTMRGTWAEQTATQEDHAVPLPDDISFVEAAALGMAAHVSGDMLRLATGLPAEGGRCLVLGASGGLGTVLLQLLRRRGGPCPRSNAKQKFWGYMCSSSGNS